MRILIIEDDKEQCTLLQFRLEKEGYSSDICCDGDDAAYYLSSNAYDLILLDCMLPHKDGLTILREMRNSGNTTPVIMLTALGELSDRISGLDCGADDYIVKPYEFGELMARIRCRLRRSSGIESLDRLCVGDVSFSAEERVLTGPADSCTLSNKEGELMELFLRNPDQTISRSTILSRIWGADYEIEDGNLDNYIYFVRRRLRKVGSTLAIKTIHSVGYRLSTEG